MSRFIVVPDTNFLMSHPNFLACFTTARSSVHLAIPLPVIKELDRIRRRRLALKSRAELERGRAAKDALGWILSIQREPPPDFTHEVLRADHIRADEDFDVQISDYAIYAARQLYPGEPVIFVTDDLGLPTVLVNAEVRRHSLSNLLIMTAAELKGRVHTLGKALVEIQQVTVKLPRISSQLDGISLYTTFRASGLKSVGLCVAALFTDEAGKPFKNAETLYRTPDNQLAVSRALTPPSTEWVQKDLQLFIPSAEFKDVMKRRYGVQGVRFAVEVSACLERDERRTLACTAQHSYLLKVALGQWFCPDETLRRAA